jgi:hypothetical protein
LRIRPEASALAPVVLTYFATVTDTTGPRVLGERSVQVATTTYGGEPAWAIIDTHGAGATASVDTVVADMASLAPFHWGATQQMPTSLMTSVAAQVSVEFRADSMFGVISGPTGRRTLVGPLPGEALLTAAHLETALRALPIDFAWRDSVTLAVTDLSGMVAVPGELAVRGTEQVQTTAGTFDCWMVMLTTPVGSAEYWVSKVDRIVVKSAQTVPESGERLEYTLTRISH